MVIASTLIDPGQVAGPHSTTLQRPLMASSEVNAADTWFHVLDQRGFIVGHQRWTAQVAGVHVVGVDTWIQLEFAEDQRRSLLLRLGPGTGLGATIDAIHATLLRSPSP